MTCWATQAADQYAADESAAEARAEAVNVHMQDAADEVLADDGNWHWLISNEDATGPLEPLFLAALNAGKDDAFAKVCALRDGLRAAAYVELKAQVERAARRMADAAIAELEAV